MANCSAHRPINPRQKNVSNVHGSYTQCNIGNGDTSINAGNEMNKINVVQAKETGHENGQNLSIYAEHNNISTTNLKSIQI